MAEAKLQSKGSPTGIKRAMFRAPIFFYKAKLGFLLGERFVMLEHIGRNSGERRRVVLEVVANEPDAVYVPSAWGTRAQWYQNIQANPDVVVHLGRHSYETVAEAIDKDEAHRVMAAYGEAHPKTLGRLANYMLEDPGETTEEQVDQVATVVPFVRLPKPG